MKNSNIDNIYNPNSSFHNSGSVEIWTKNKVWLCLVNLSQETENMNGTSITLRGNAQANTYYDHRQGTIVTYLPCVLSPGKFSLQCSHLTSEELRLKG